MIDLTQRWQVLNADCLDVLRELPDGCVDATVTDPPYGVGIEYASFEDTKDNLSVLVRSTMPEIIRVSDVVALTPGNGNQTAYPKPDWTMCWFNGAGAHQSPWGFTCWQPILVWGRCPYRRSNLGARPDGWAGNHPSRPNGHPCPKPVEFMRWLVERVSLVGDLILDPFCGSGTTGVACMQTGRRFIGIEIDAGYCEISRRRIAEAANTLWTPPAPREPEKALFAEGGAA